MPSLLALSRAIDRFSGWVGHQVSWLIVLAVFVSAGNAIIRKLFDVSSNAWLEAQWWLFSMVFLLASAWTLRDNEHIRIDVVNSQLPAAWRNWIEIIGHVFFLLPTAALVTYASWNYAVSSWVQREGSLNAGGLPQWPIKMLIPVAFALLFVQGVSELIKRVAIMRGLGNGGPHDHSYHDEVTDAASTTHTTAPAGHISGLAGPTPVRKPVVSPVVSRK